MTRRVATATVRSGSETGRLALAGSPDYFWLRSRKQFDELLTAVREGDVVMVNRLACNMVHKIQLVEKFNRHGVHFRALDLGIDSRTPAGKMITGGGVFLQPV